MPRRRQRPRIDVVEDVEWMLASGETHPDAIAHRLGYRSRSVLYLVLRRAGRRDLIKTISNDQGDQRWASGS